jgi:hypothetical protein
MRLIAIRTARELKPDGRQAFGQRYDRDWMIPRRDLP